MLEIFEVLLMCLPTMYNFSCTHKSAIQTSKPKSKESKQQIYKIELKYDINPQNLQSDFIQSKSRKIILIVIIKKSSVLITTSLRKM